MQSKWITHKGKQIFHSNLSLETLAVETQAVLNEFRQQPLNSVLSLLDARGLMLTPQALKLAKEITPELAKHIRKVAVLSVGNSEAHRIALDILGKLSGPKTSQAFNDEEQAKDWLVEE